MNQERIALTFGDAGENHVGNQMLGEKQAIGTGFTTNDLKLLLNYFINLGLNCQYVDLSSILLESKNVDKLENINGISAGVLVIREFVKKEDRLNVYNELKNIEWDRKYYDRRRKRVLNKHARANLVFVDGYEQEPDYDNGKGRVVDSKKIKTLNSIKSSLIKHIEKGLKSGGSNTKSINYICEGNRYFDLKKCGIGYHGDKERTRVICLSIGSNNYPIRWVWFYKSKPVTNFKEVKLNNGDIYIMSEKAVGYDWIKRKIPTLRHSAGAYKYINLDKYEKSK